MLSAMDIARPARSLKRTIAAPLRRYLDRRFDRVDERLTRLERALAPGVWELLSRVDLSQHNVGRTPPDFDHVVSQAASAAQFSHPDFERLRRLMYPSSVILPWGKSPGSALHRKVWEFVYVLRAAEQSGVLTEGRAALGFGVGREPIPAALASYGVTVLATDLSSAEDESTQWATTGQHLTDLSALSHPEIVPDDYLEQHVSLRYVDMNEIPDDLGTYDLVWSCCALEHLGSPHAGLDFLLRTLGLLRPGGVAVHTTELELTPRSETADYGHLAVYRIRDLDGVAEMARERGFEIETNWYVAMETASDRWIGRHPFDDPAHLKILIGDSISTSVGLVITRPSEGAPQSAA